MNAPLDRYELYRVITDYEALQDGFLDRIEDLNTTLEQIDMAAGLTKGNAQKLLSKNPGKMRSDRPNTVSRRTFGWESLGKMLEGTGMALVLAVDDQRFAPIKEQLGQRKRHVRAAAASIEKCTIQPAEIIREYMRELSKKSIEKNAQSKGGKRRAQVMKKRARQRAATHAARMRWSKRDAGNHQQG